MSDSVRPHRRQSTRLHCPWDSPGKNTGVGCHFLLQCVKVKSLSCVRLLATPWTAAYQAPPSMGFARQEYWSGVPLPSPPNVCKHHQKSGCILSLKKKLSKYLLKLYRSYSLTTIQQNKKISLNNVKTSNQKCWLAISFSGDLPNPGIKTMLLLSPALAGGFFAASASHFHIKNKIHNYKDVSTPLSD